MMSDPSPFEWAWPPEVFWLSPCGEVVEIIGHLTAMRENPERFGLPSPPRTKREIDEAFRFLWAHGWIRGRFSSGTFWFHLDRPRPDALARARILVSKFARFVDRVDIDFAEAWPARTLKSADFLDDRHGTRG